MLFRAGLHYLRVVLMHYVAHCVAVGAIPTACVVAHNPNGNAMWTRELCSGPRAVSWA